MVWHGATGSAQAAWGLGVVLSAGIFFAGCGSDGESAADPEDAAESDATSGDWWQPPAKDAGTAAGDVAVAEAGPADAGGPGTDAGGPGADVDAAAGGGSDTAFVADIGGGLPSEVTAIAPAFNLFAPAGIHEVKIALPANEWTAYLDGVAKPDGTQVYKWHKADVEVDGISYTSVGIHGFGNGSQIENPGKPNIKLKFDKYVAEGWGPENQRSFRLKASGQDPTYLREPIAGAMLRSVGGAAPRFSWALVTVNGVEYGPYLLQETVDKRFFHNTFGNNDGAKLTTTSGCYGIDCGTVTDCATLKTKFEADPGDPQQIVDLASLIATATEAQLPDLLANHFYLDELLADYAVDAAISNLDGFASAAQNFTFYVDELTGRFHLIAQGTDLTFGMFGNAWYELATPWGPPNSWCKARKDPLYTRIWNSPVLRPQLLAKLRGLQCGLLRDTTLLPLVASYHKALKPYIDNEPKGIYSPKQVDDFYVKLEKYVTARQKTLSDLLQPCP